MCVVTLSVIGCNDVAACTNDASFGMNESTNTESESILREAAAVAESSTGQMFPSVPNGSQETTTKFL